MARPGSYVGITFPEGTAGTPVPTYTEAEDDEALRRFGGSVEDWLKLEWEERQRLRAAVRESGSC